VEVSTSKKAWYFHRFYDFQPDLNTSNPEVQAEILNGSAGIGGGTLVGSVGG
jgi:glycosidase